MSCAATVRRPHLCARGRVALELRAGEERVVARVHVVEALLHVASEHLRRALHQDALRLERHDERADAWHVCVGRQADAVVQVAGDEGADAVRRVELLDQRPGLRRIEGMYGVRCAHAHDC